MRIPPIQAVFNVLAAFLFAVFAWFQRNDIDPAVYYKPSSLDALIWFLFYLLIAGLFLVTLFRGLPNWLLILSALACLAEMIATGPGLIENFFGDAEFNMTQVSMSASDPRVELSREFFGALIALVGVGYLMLQQRRLKNATDAG
tara:strand:+ start:2159 stop:2593 length:435 start_codon:yes stop_codon:yes gene_type:complete